MIESRILIAAGAVSFLLAACSSTPLKTDAAAAPIVSPKPAEAASTAAPEVPRSAPATIPTVNASSLPPYLDPNNPLAKQHSVYFDFDSAAVKSTYLPVIEEHGHFLASARKVTIKIEGNCDERGSAEYNLALGQRRADAVATALRNLGVTPGQMEETSWGKEKPSATGHDEAAWAQNRRADIVYLAQP